MPPPESVYFDDSILDVNMSALNISIDSTGSPTPRSPRSPTRLGGSCSRRFMRKAEEEDDNININDNIHGLIQVPPVLRAIIDTPQFDR